jgi:hypothetical protein
MTNRVLSSLSGIGGGKGMMTKKHEEMEQLEPFVSPYPSPS